MRKKICVCVLGVVCLTGAVAAWATWAHNYPAHHFAVVEKGVLYRSGQPQDRDRWRAIKDRYHIRTVVSLRHLRPDADWWKTEVAFCRRNGINLVYMPLVRTGVTDAELERFFQIVDDPAQQPVLVHCHAGSRRTGVMVAAYRIAVQGWNYEKAVAEAETFRFRADKDKAHDDVLRILAAEGAPRHGEVGPTARTNP